MKKVLYVNENKAKKTLSNKTFKEDLVYSAHSEENPSLKPYINIDVLKELLSPKQFEKLEADLGL